MEHHTQTQDGYLVQLPWTACVLSSSVLSPASENGYRFLFLSLCMQAVILPAAASSSPQKQAARPCGHSWRKHCEFCPSSFLSYTNLL